MIALAIIFLIIISLTRPATILTLIHKIFTSPLKAIDTIENKINSDKLK